jgi:hypothetical protein
VLASAAATVAACNAISGLDRDYELATRAADGAGLDVVTHPDVQADGPGGGGGTPDAGGPLDCLDPPGAEHGVLKFCDNFEDPSKHWTASYTTGGSPTIMANAGRFGTSALHATVTRAGGATALRQTVVLPAELAAGKTLWLSFYFYVVQTSIDYVALGAIQFSGSEHGIALYTGSCPGGASTCINENDQSGRGHDPARAIPSKNSQWYHAEVEVVRNGTDYGGEVVLDGAMINLRTTGAMPPTLVPSPPIEVVLGAFYTGQGTTTEVFIDDVVVRLSQ